MLDKVLNQGGKRNVDQFPDDFMFRVNAAKESEVVTNCDHLADLKKRDLHYLFFRKQFTLAPLNSGTGRELHA